MAYRTSAPNTPPPIARLDGANVKRLDSVADAFLVAPAGKTLDVNDRKLMLGEIKSRRGADVADRSDTYVAQRFACLRGDDVPADGMAPGSIVAAEFKGSAKAQRTKINAYLNRARTELSNAYGSGITKQPNPGDVETRAFELAQTDPEGKFR